MATKKLFRDVFKRSDNCLAIVGKFSLEDDADLRLHTLSNTSDAEGTLNTDEFFRIIRPEICTEVSGTISIGETTFNSYDLGSPLTLPHGEAQPIAIDSPLLSSEAYTEPTVKKIQLQGAKLFKELLRDLDCLAQFWQSNFSRSILKVARHYLLHYANSALSQDKSKNKSLIGDDNWFKMLAVSHELSTSVVLFLTCARQDDSSALSKVKAQLANQPLGAKKKLTIKQQELVAEALVNLKVVMLSAKEAHNDSTFSSLMELDVFKRFIPDCTTDKEYGLQNVQGVDDKRFLSYFQFFMVASDNVNRFVRTKALHSYLFCWLASKYHEHDGETMGDAERGPAKSMFETGVEGQGDKRIPSESAEEREKNNEIIEQAEIEEKDIAGEVQEDENYSDFQQLNVTNLIAITNPSRAFTKNSLLERMKKLFGRLAQLGRGKAGELLADNADFNESLVKFYRCILNTDIGGKEKVDLDTFKNRLLKHCAKSGEFDEKVFVEGFLKEITKPDKSAKKLQLQVKYAFLEAFARQSKTRFAKTWIDNKLEINADAELFDELYGIYLGLEVSGSESESGSSAVIVTPASVPDLNESEETRERRKENFAVAGRLAKDRKPSLRSVELPRPNALASQPDGAEGTVTVNGEEVATLTVKDKGKVVVKAESASAGALAN